MQVEYETPIDFEVEYSLEDNVIEVDIGELGVQFGADMDDFIAPKCIIPVSSPEELPPKGSSNVLYIVNNEAIYYYDKSIGQYVVLTSGKDAIGNGTVVIKSNGVLISTFTMNQKEDTEVNLSVPTKVSELDNDKKYIEEDSKAVIDIDFSNFFS